MKERDFDALARELEDLLNYSGYEPTMVKVVVDDDVLKIILLGSSKNTFYHLEELTDFCRCKKMTAYATIEEGNLVYRVF